jgi:hydroxyacylglutathione hydrolase
VAFSSSIDPGNEAIQKLVAYCSSNEVTTGKFTIGDEKEFNVFMRLDSDAVRRELQGTHRVSSGVSQVESRVEQRADRTVTTCKGKSGTDDPIEAMAYLREAKNNFRG